jgi:hypothetical protein
VGIPPSQSLPEDLGEIRIRPVDVLSSVATVQSARLERRRLTKGGILSDDLNGGDSIGKCMIYLLLGLCV